MLNKIITFIKIIGEHNFCLPLFEIFLKYYVTFQYLLTNYYIIKFIKYAKCYINWQVNIYWYVIYTY